MMDDMYVIRLVMPCSPSRDVFYNILPSLQGRILIPHVRSLLVLIASPLIHSITTVVVVTGNLP